MMQYGKMGSQYVTSRENQTDLTVSESHTNKTYTILIFRKKREEFVSIYCFL